MYVFKIILSKSENEVRFSDESFIGGVFDDKNLALDAMYNYMDWYNLNWEWDDSWYLAEFDNKWYHYIVDVSVTMNFELKKWYWSADIYRL